MGEGYHEEGEKGKKESVALVMMVDDGQYGGSNGGCYFSHHWCKQRRISFTFW